MIRALKCTVIRFQRTTAIAPLNEGAMMLPAWISFFIGSLFCFSAFGQNDVPRDDILIEHNSRFLVRDGERQEIHLVSIIADQVLSASRAYIHIWRFDSMKQMSEYLEMQHENGPGVPKEVDLLRCEIIVLTMKFINSPEEKFIAHDRTYYWSPGSAKVSWLRVDNLEEMEVLDFQDMTSTFRPLQEKFMPWKEYARKHNSATSLRNAIEFK